MPVDPISSVPEEEAAVRRFLPTSFDQRYHTLAALDPTFADVWVSHLGRLLKRPALDPRKRFLILTGQYTMRADAAMIGEITGAAIDDGVAPGELVEVIVQCYVYAGGDRVATALAAVREQLAQRGRLADFTASRQEVVRPERSLKDEREHWSPADRDDPRLTGFLDRYGWGGLSRGLTLRPGHHINVVATLDAIDPGFLQIWLDTTYRDLYGRLILDDATRLLCTVADCFAVGETHQARRHIRGALRQGTTPAELFELIFQTCAVIGHPYMLPIAVDDLLLILEDVGRLDEVLDGDDRDEVMATVRQRLARRDGIQDSLAGK